MRYLFTLTTILALLLIAGCDSSTGVLDPILIEQMVGNWEGTLDYTPSGGEEVAMTLEFDLRSVFWLSATMVADSVTYEDDDVVKVDTGFKMEFAVTEETWYLTLTGSFTGADIGGSIVQREEGQQDVTLGTWTASPVI